MNYCIELRGIVQGVGFRPFALRLANELDLSGNVRNRNGIVNINITGDKEALDEYVRRLTLSAPDSAVIMGMDINEISDEEYAAAAATTAGVGAGRPGPDGLAPDGFEPDGPGSHGSGNHGFVGRSAAGLDPGRPGPGGRGKARFVIAESDAPATASQTPALSPDIATCRRCESEMYDKNNRRYLHPFISCTDCGPRYSIIESIPYDRETTSMRDFYMCGECVSEYRNPQDVRCHAQTIACHDCGPVLKLKKPGGAELSGRAALFEARAMLDNGEIIAIKDIGGYHFACRADDTEAICKLRELKKRQSKSFAVMFRNIEEIKKYAYVNETEEECLKSKARPIVLVKKIPGEDVLDEACGDSIYIGAMLASNPVQIYLANECGTLIMTSGNLGGEPIIISDEKMESLIKAKGIISGMLCHDRRIVTPLDDSIVRVICGRTQVLRRARGYVPLPIYFKNCKSSETILAAGGDLKASFCFLKDTQGTCSQYFGDLDDYDAGGLWKSNIKRIAGLYNLKPHILACDMHPKYYSAHMAEMLYDFDEVIKVQHHHAHIASVAAEHGLAGEVLGYAFDGTGYGCDKTIWGGEALLLNGHSFKRLAHLETVPMCGGDEIARDADMALMCYLINGGIEPDAVYDMDVPEYKEKYMLIKSVLEHRIGISYSSSMGRVFDAACALIGIRHYNNYEGECAMALEKAACMYEAFMLNECADGEDSAGNPSGKRMHFELLLKDGIWDTSGLIRQIAKLRTQGAYKTGCGQNEAAYAFHEAIADAVAEHAYAYAESRSAESQSAEDRRAESSCAKDKHERIQVALSGGVFANSLLTKMIIDKLKNDRYVVYFNEKVPANDGGIALGQAYIAAGILNDRKRW